MTCITLTTDFSLADGYSGVLHGVIFGIAPQAKIVDLCHMVDPQNILQGALVLVRHAPYFPAGTVHLAVVDPGVGTSRRPLAGHIGRQFFCGPDNGLVSLLLDEAGRLGEESHLVELDRPQYWLSPVSNVFHGRDIFAPAAAHLANGTPLQELGSPVNDPVRIRLPEPELKANRLLGQILFSDAFGNLITSIRQEHLAGDKPVALEVAGVTIRQFVQAYAQAPADSLAVLQGSSGFLEISVVNGNAAAFLNVKAGNALVVHLAGKTSA